MGVTQIILFTTVTAVSAYLSTIIFEEWKKQRIPTNWKQVAMVKKLYLYPLKSGRRKELKKAECTKVGLREIKKDDDVPQLRDRKLVLYNTEHNEFVTARNYPQMVLIEVSVYDENHLAVEAPTMPTLLVKIPNRKDNDLVLVKCWYGEKIFGIDCGDEAASWFSRYILEKDSGVRLAYNDASQKRDITKAFEKLIRYYKNLDNDSTGLYADLASLHLINQSSIRDMNDKIGNSSISPEFFRPNIVIDDLMLEAYAEDNWDWIKIGEDVVLRNVKECTRCSLTTIDAETGIRNSEREPLKTLNTYRLTEGPEKAPVMGIYLGVKRGGFLKEGDYVYVASSCK